jgi:hypothetical protein
MGPPLFTQQNHPLPVVHAIAAVSHISQHPGILTSHHRVSPLYSFLGLSIHPKMASQTAERSKPQEYYLPCHYISYASLDSHRLEAL